MLKRASLIIGLAMAVATAAQANQPAAPAAPTATAPAPATGMWVPGVAAAKATVAGQSGGKDMIICRMPMPNKEVHNGKGWNDSCYVGFGGKELKAPLAQAQVLVLPNTTWVEVKDGKLPETAYQAGMSGGAPMNVCRGKVPSGEAHPGKLWKGNCYIGFGGKELKLPTYEVLTVTK